MSIVVKQQRTLNLAWTKPSQFVITSQNTQYRNTLNHTRMTFLWASHLSPVPKQAPWTLSLLRSSAADCSCISGNREVYFKNFLLFSDLGALCDAVVLVHCQGRMKTRTNCVSVWLCVCSGGEGVPGYPLQRVLHCLPFSLNVQACAYFCKCGCVCLSQSLGFCVCLYFGEMSVCFHAAGQGGLVSLSIDTAARPRLLMGWCDKDFFFCMCGSV